MIDGIGALGTRVYEGASIFGPYDSPPPTVVAGVGGLVGGAAGTVMGRFGWADPTTGAVDNARTSAGQIPGLVIPHGGGWTRVYCSGGVWIARKGLPVTMAAGGKFWVRFPGGAYAGQPCYADLVDGHAISGYAVGAEATVWTVCGNALPGNLAPISSQANF